MTVKLQELAIKANLELLWYSKSDVMVAMRYKNSKKQMLRDIYIYIKATPV